MSKTITIATIFIISLLYGCCKDKIITPENNLKGKVKTIRYTDSTDNDSLFFYYIYDSVTGKIKNITTYDSNDTAYTNIYYEFNKVIYRNSMSNYIGISYLNNNQLQTSTSFDTSNIIESVLFRVAYTNTIADTIIELGTASFINNLTNYDFESTNNNITKHKISWSVYNILSGTSDTYYDTIFYEYGNILNPYYLPSQSAYSKYLYMYTGVVYDFPNDALPLNGYSILPKNKNLIKSVKSVNFGYITNYSYTFNSLNQVTEMRISKPDGTGVALTYKMTYY